MSRVVILDSAPVGEICGPGGRPATDDAQRWLSGLVNAGVRVILPDIIDYENRRELIRRRASKQLDFLDALGLAIDADMILVGQAQSLQLPDAVIATTNVRHLARFFPAEHWTNVSAA